MYVSYFIGSGHSIHVQAHKELGDVLYSLRTVLNKYPALHTTDVLTAAAVLITKVKSKLTNVKCKVTKVKCKVTKVTCQLEIWERPSGCFNVINLV